MATYLAGSNVLKLGKLQKSEAEEVMKTRLVQKHHHPLEDQEIFNEFLDILTFHPFAIVQLVAFINRQNSTISDNISLCRDREQEATNLPSTEFEDDNSRYRERKNPIATKWYISFVSTTNFHGAPQPINQFTTPTNTTVFVGGLFHHITGDELRSFFQGFGVITYVRIPPGKCCGPAASSSLSGVRLLRWLSTRCRGYPIGQLMQLVACRWRLCAKVLNEVFSCVKNDTRVLDVVNLAQARACEDLDVTPEVSLYQELQRKLYSITIEYFKTLWRQHGDIVLMMDDDCGTTKMVGDL